MIDEAIYWAPLVSPDPSITTVSKQLLSQLVTRIRALDQRVNEFISMHVKHRIYAELIRWSRPDSATARQAVVRRAAGSRVAAPVHADIAAPVSTPREMVARELTAFLAGCEQPIVRLHRIGGRGARRASYHAT
jgi:hypothetical protein